MAGAVGIEPTMEDSESSALPLGYAPINDSHVLPYPDSSGLRPKAVFQYCKLCLF